MTQFVSAHDERFPSFMGNAMTSIHTNAGAIAALQTLRALDSSMQTVQGQVSSGLRIATASDNAAYWSIATTMRSDNMAISAVEDALGLGAATVDTAYAGMTAVVDVLSEFKARLVAAKEEGVDRGKIQEELDQLNGQAESIARSASFSGVNWFLTHEDAHLSSLGKYNAFVTSSFVRASDGSVSVKKFDMDLKTTSLLNKGGGGALQKELGGPAPVGNYLEPAMRKSGHNGHEDRTFTGPAAFGAGDFVEFVLTIDSSTHSPGISPTIRIDKALVDAALGSSDGLISTADEMRLVLEKFFVDQSIPATTNSTYGSVFGSAGFEIGSRELSGHAGSSIYISGVTSSFAGGFAFGLEDPVRTPSLDHDNMYPTWGGTFPGPITLTGSGNLSFDLQVGAGAPMTVTVGRATVDAALGSSDGRIGSASDLATVLTHATQGLGIVVTASGDDLTFVTDQSIYPEAGNRAVHIALGPLRADTSTHLRFDLAEIDITASFFTIDEYITGLERMLSKVVSGAATLGALQARIDMQTEFAAKLSDSIDSGIGRLVDADMNEASTRLKAIQTQQQLASQSLSIANSAPETMLQLFR